VSSNPALDRFWEEFSRIEPTAELGGIDANKPGYHERRVDLPADDYSVGQVAADRRGRGTVASAIDLTMYPAGGAAMRKYTGRLKAAALARDPRLWLRGGPTLREFIGTDDGERVFCYVFTGGVPLGVGADSGPDWGRDESHLWHVHLSIIRQYAEDWPALDAVLSVLRGESLAEWRARTEFLMALSDNDQQALIWRIEALTKGRTAVAGGPTKGEPVELIRRLAALEQAAAAEVTRDAALPAELADRLAGPVAAAVREELAGMPAEVVEAAVARVVGRVRVALDAAPPVG
jgi:hypothetical protein